MSRGELVPDEVTIKMLLERISESRRHVRRLPPQRRPGQSAR
jgi:adenylate kinase family enzyme